MRSFSWFFDVDAYLSNQYSDQNSLFHALSEIAYRDHKGCQIDVQIQIISSQWTHFTEEKEYELPCLNCDCRIYFTWDVFRKKLQIQTQRRMTVNVDESKRWSRRKKCQGLGRGVSRVVHIKIFITFVQDMFLRNELSFDSSVDSLFSSKCDFWMILR